MEFYIDSRGITQAGQKKALLLHSAGMEVQDLFETLADPGVPEGEADDANAYQKTVRTLDAHLIPQVNIPYERHQFRQIKQEGSETMDQFITRLQHQANNCNFTNKEETIRDQVIDTCRSKHLRRKLLQQGTELTLKHAQDLARAMEAVDLQAREMESGGAESRTDVVNSVRVSDSVRQRKGECYRCGRKGHYRNDKECPARTAKCDKCQKLGHFANKCHTKGLNKDSPEKKSNFKRFPHKKQVNYTAADEQEADSDSEYTFNVNCKEEEADYITLEVGGVSLKLLVDSGSPSNIIDESTWDMLKSHRIKCTTDKNVTKQFYAYGQDRPLTTKGSFICKVKSREAVLEDAEFVVIQGKGPALLGRRSAKELGILQVGPTVIASVSKVPGHILEKFPRLFSGIGKLKDRSVTLHVRPDVEPVAQPLRRTPFQLRQKVDAKIKELLDEDIIEAVVDTPTSWVNPVVIVPKANNEIRLCIDMRRANEAIQRVRHPIPTVDELLQSMNGSTVFSKLDLKWGYHQIELDPGSRDITTFATSSGLFRYKRLFFGVNSATEQYQHEIQRVLSGLQGAANISDDVIVHGRGQEDHDKNVMAVLSRLDDANVTLNPEKCEFNMPRLIFMGMLLSKRGIGPTEERIRAVLEAREPESVPEVRSFLGLVNFSSRFIPQYATLSEPLRRLTRKDVSFDFGPEQVASFKALKSSLANASELAYFDKDAPTKVIADASPVGLGAVLVQDQKEGPVAISYASRSLTDCEQRYSQTEKEALALVWACEKFHPYIYGGKFTLVTDHKPLETIYGPRSRPCARIERWVLRLQQYDFQVEHISGRDMIADSLSRLVNANVMKDTHKHGAEEYVKFVAVAATPKALTTHEVEVASDKDEELQMVREAIATGKFEDCKSYAPIAGELCTVGKLVLRGTRIVIPSSLRPRVLALAHEGHLGITGTKQVLRTKVWWPGIDRAAEKFCRSCHGCQLVTRPDAPEPLRPSSMPDGPWQDVSTDLLGPLPSGHSLLVVVDYFSRYYEVRTLKSTSTDKVIECLEDIFATHGLPLTLKSDNGPQFRSAEFRDYCADNGIVHCKVTARWPQANGEVERQNSSILKRLRISQAEGKDWRKELRKYLVQYRNLEHPSTGRSPAELLFGRKTRDKLPSMKLGHDLYHQDVRDHDAEAKGRTKLYVDNRRHASYSEVALGDEVLLKQDKTDKLSTTFNATPHKVIAKSGNSVVVESPSGARYNRNTTHLRKFVPRDVEPTSSVPEQSEETEVTMDTPVSVTNGDIMDTHADSPRPTRMRKTPEKLKDYVLK